MKEAKEMAKDNTVGNGKLKALEGAISQIEKRFGKGAIMRLGEAGSLMAVDVIPSGSLSLDLALGVGGIPRGRVTEIFGTESSGKTTLAYHVAAEAQRLGGVVIYIDAEHALDLEYVGKCGVKVDDLLISQPDCGEQALEIAEEVIRSGAVDVVVIDSVAALTPRAEIEGEMGDAHVGLQARLMSQALRKLSGVISSSRTAVIFINQLREKVGTTHGNREITPGGRALKFYASVRIDLRIVDTVQVGGTERVGSVVVAKVVKNKVAPPFRQARFDIMFGQGISREGEILDLGEAMGILKKKGAWYYRDGEVLGQGRETAREFLRDHRDVARQIEGLIRSKVVSPAFRIEETAEYPGRKPGNEVEPGSDHQGAPEATTADMSDADEWHQN